MKIADLPDERGHFGPYGGVFVAETLVHALEQPGREIVLPRPGLRDWVYASDLAQGILLLLDAQKLNHEVYNIGSGFRWRTAMNDYYMAYWDRLRHIEGASQRVQDDTMRFSRTLEDLGVRMIESVMTLIAFLPVLLKLSTYVTELQLIGPVPHSLVVVSIVWSLFGTTFLALVGIRLPGLEFRNQRVEAAYRKELVYGEDDVVGGGEGVELLLGGLGGWGVGVERLGDEEQDGGMAAGFSGDGLDVGDGDLGVEVDARLGADE